MQTQAPGQECVKLKRHFKHACSQNLDLLMRVKDQSILCHFFSVISRHLLFIIKHYVFLNILDS